MRKCMWYTLGFGTACVFCAYLFVPRSCILPILLSALVLLAVFRKQHWVKPVFLLLVGILGGIFWFSRFQSRVLAPLHALDGTTGEVSVRCCGYGEKTDYGYRAEGRIEIGERIYPILLYLDETVVVEPGDILTGPFLFQATTPGGQKESSYYQGEGIFLLAYQKEELTCSKDIRTWQDIPAILRQRILRILEEHLPADAAAFARALLLGDTSQLDYTVLTHFTVSGIRHIVAVSGLHVSVLFGLLTFLAFRNRVLTTMAALPVLVMFAAMTGFAPSVSRACMMCGLMMMASLVNREYDGPTALAFSGLVLLILNPLVIVSVGYQLSFASVAGIFLFAPGIRNWIRSCFRVKKENRIGYRLVSWLSLSVSVTLGATAATLPLCALHFGVISLAAVLTNLLVLWAVSLIFYGLMGLCMISVLWKAGADFLGLMLAVLIRFVVFSAKMVGGFPLSAVYTCSPYIAAWLIFVYILLAVFLLSKNKQPTMLVCCVVLSLFTALTASWSGVRKGEIRFAVLDVGQGQCVLLQAEGRNYMVDCGGSSDGMAADTAAEFLLSQGITKLDALILNHYDRDHFGGVENLLSRVGTELVILPPVYTPWNPDAGQILYATEDLLLSAENTKISIYTSEFPGNSNENSLCILFDTENCDILITGDRDEFGERMLLRHHMIPDVDILVAGHHGSRLSSGEDLLAAARPEIVCISAGAGNRFGHPEPELLQRLENHGCTVYRTDLQGNIIIRR